MKLPQKQRLIEQYSATNLSILSNTESSEKLVELQKLIKTSNEHKWVQDFTADKLSKMYGLYKAHKDTSGPKTCGHRRPGK